MGAVAADVLRYVGGAGAHPGEEDDQLWKRGVGRGD